MKPITDWTEVLVLPANLPKGTRLWRGCIAKSGRSELRVGVVPGTQDTNGLRVIEVSFFHKNKRVARYPTTHEIGEAFLRAVGDDAIVQATFFAGFHRTEPLVEHCADGDWYYYPLNFVEIGKVQKSEIISRTGPSLN